MKISLFFLEISFDKDSWIYFFDIFLFIFFFLFSLLFLLFCCWWRFVSRFWSLNPRSLWSPMSFRKYNKQKTFIKFTHKITFLLFFLTHLSAIKLEIFIYKLQRIFFYFQFECNFSQKNNFTWLFRENRRKFHSIFLFFCYLAQKKQLIFFLFNNFCSNFDSILFRRRTRISNLSRRNLKSNCSLCRFLHSTLISSRNCVPHFAHNLNFTHSLFRWHS